jgi:type III secretory pathway lipoprotein EscJ
MRVYLLACWLLAAGSARADSPLGALVPTARERSEARTRELEQALAPMLAALAGVARAELRLDLPDTTCAPLDQPLPDASASVLLELAPGATPPRDATVRDLVAGAARELATARVHVTHAPRKAAPGSEPLLSAGPLVVPAPSAEGLRVALAASLLANVMLATVLLWILKRRPRSARPY